ncbi:uncharacterized [Tachysurus ichikawai]
MFPTTFPPCPGGKPMSGVTAELTSPKVATSSRQAKAANPARSAATEIRNEALSQSLSFVSRRKSPGEDSRS